MHSFFVWDLRSQSQSIYTPGMSLYTYSQKVAMAIDKNAEHPSVRKLFTVEEEKKCLSVNIGSRSELQSGEFIQEISKQIARNLDNPDYIQIMEADFSQSTST